MKVRDFLHSDFSMRNNSKLRKIKLSICVALLTFSFVIIGYKTISLASFNNVNIKNISSKKINQVSLSNLIVEVFMIEMVNFWQQL